MRVLVLLPTTGALNRVLRVTPRPDLSTSQVFMQGDYKPLAISADYDALTAEAGPLAVLAPLLKPGPHHLRLAGPIDSGKSWELPTVLAHLVAALGDELAEEPAKADIVLWSTGAVDLDLNIVDFDYKLAAKVAYSRACLQESAAAGARIVAILPACEDSSPLRDALAEIGGQRTCVACVGSVSAARRVLEEALGRDAPPAAAAASASSSRRVVGAPLLFSVAGVVLAASAFGAVAIRPDWLPPTWGWGAHKGGDRGVDASGAGPGGAGARGSGDDVREAATGGGSPDSAGQADAGADPGDAAAAGQTQHDPAGQSGSGAAQARDGNPHQPEAAQETSNATSNATSNVASNEAPRDASKEPSKEASQKPSQEPSQEAAQTPAEAGRPFPVQIVELRDRNDRSCIPVLFERVPPRRVDVAVDGPGSFRDSQGRNLCGLELTLNPESGAQDLDIELPMQRSGFRLTPSGAPGARNKIKVEFTQELRQTFTYNVFVKFGGAQAPEPVRQLRHRIIGMTLGWSNEGERH